MSDYTVVNPATEEEVVRVPGLTAEAVENAVARAKDAAQDWAGRSPADRASGLRAFAAAVDGARHELATLETTNSGHPITSSRWEAEHVRDVLLFAAGMPERMSGRQIPVAGGFDVTFHEPFGVVGVITPWNFPMTIASWGVAPALAAGNAVLLKPAEWTPLTSLRLAELASESGLPEGIFQVLPGKGAVVGQALVSHPEVRKLVFTGSTAVGKSIAADAAARVKRLTLELGGKSANIVFDDADVDLAAATAPSAVFDNAGQDCCARSRILVQRGVFDRFMAGFEKSVAAWRVGDPGEEATQMGPLVSRQHRESVAAFVPEDDRAVAFRGSCPDGPGFWFAPTVLTPGRRDRVMREEIFGPVASVVPFDDEADAFELANDTEYGLSGSIWTRSLDRAYRAARAVQSGNLSVNSHSSVRYSTPFGGMKQSGLGRELGPDAALAFTETKNVFFAAI